LAGPDWPPIVKDQESRWVLREIAWPPKSMQR
jgi:hypothetical protein